MQKKQNKSLKGGEKKVGDLGTYRNDTAVSSLHFFGFGLFFCSYIPDWMLEKPVTQKHQQTQRYPKSSVLYG